MGKKKKPEQDMLEEGFWQEFEDTLEHLRRAKAIIVITLDRKTGDVEIDDSMSTPAETWYALSSGEQMSASYLTVAPGDEDA